MLSLGRRAGVPSVLHYRVGTLPEVIARGGLGWALTQRAVRLASRVVVLDTASEEALRRAVPEAAVLRLPNMVELDAVECLDPAAPRCRQFPKGPRIVFVGHVVPTKGVRELFEACLGLVDTPWVLDLVGTADPEFQQAPRSGGRRGRQGAKGPLPRPRGPPAGPSVRSRRRPVRPAQLHRGAPNVVLEAMACSRPILATTVGAIPEMLDADGVEPCGVCVPPRDFGACVARWPPCCGARHAAPNWAGGRVGASRSGTQYRSHVVWLSVCGNRLPPNHAVSAVDARDY